MRVRRRKEVFSCSQKKKNGENIPIQFSSYDNEFDLSILFNFTIQDDLVEAYKKS